MWFPNKWLWMVNTCDMKKINDLKSVVSKVLTLDPCPFYGGFIIKRGLKRY